MNGRLMLANKPVLAMVHPHALPGSYLHNKENMEQILDSLYQDVSILSRNRVDGVLLQNINDVPQREKAPIETIAYMTRCAEMIRRMFPKLLLGIMINWDGCASLAVADAAGADFARVEHAFLGAEIWYNGLHSAQCVDVMHLKKKLASDVQIYGGIHNPDVSSLDRRSIGLLATEAVEFGRADGLFMSGSTVKECIAFVQEAKAQKPDVKIILGAKATAENIGELLPSYDGVCVGRDIRGGNLYQPVDEESVARFMEEVERVR